MKKTLFTFAALLVATYSYTYGGGSPTGRSGSPASNGQTCSGSYCHSGGSANGDELVDILVNVTPFAGSPTYTDSLYDNVDASISLQVNAAGRSKIGFSASIEDASGNFIGTVSKGSGNAKIVGGNYATHTATSTSVSNDQISWSWNWETGTVPDSATIYVAVNYTNSNGQASGDYIMTAKKTLYKGMQAMNMDEDRAGQALNVYPNPARDVLHIEGTDVKEAYLYDLSGRFQSMVQFTASGHMDVSMLSSGTYLLKVVGNHGQEQYKHVVIE